MMAQTSFALLTNTGRAKEAAALANGTSIVITHIAIGDGSTVPSGGESSLYNEVVRKTISGHGVVVGANHTAYFDCYLTAEEGPYTIRETGLYDEDGDLIAIAHYNPPINKPTPTSGQTIEATIRLEVQFSNTANVVVVVDPSMQVALQRLTVTPWIPVKSRSLTAPPASPSIGDTYVIPAGPTGAWAGHAQKVAEFTLAGWAIIDTPNGHGVGLPDGRVFEKVDGSYVEKIALDVQTGKWSYAVASGTANALTVALSPAPASLVAGLTICVWVADTNTAAPTINVNGLGAKPIVDNVSGGALPPKALISGAMVRMTYDGTAFRVDTSTYDPFLITTALTKVLHGPDADFPSLIEFFDWLSYRRITQSGFVSVTLPPGQLVYSSHITVDHPNLSRISINGATLLAAAPTKSEFTITGDSSLERAADNAANLAMLRDIFATELKFTSNAGIRFVSSGPILERLLITGNGAANTPGFDGLSLASGGALNTVSIHGFGEYGLALGSGQTTATAFSASGNGHSGLALNSGSSFIWNNDDVVLASNASAGMLALGGGARANGNGRFACLGNGGAGATLDLGAVLHVANTRAAFEKNGTMGLAVTSGFATVPGAAFDDNGSIAAATTSGGTINATGATGLTGNATPVVNTVGNGNSIIIH